MFTLITLKLKRKPSGDLIFSYKKEKQKNLERASKAISVSSLKKKQTVSSSEEIVVCVKMVTP